MITIKIKSISTLRNMAMGLYLLKSKVLENKSKVNPGSEGSENLNFYYTEKINEITSSIIDINYLLDKNYKIPHHFCLKNEMGKDTYCSQQ